MEEKETYWFVSSLQFENNTIIPCFGIHKSPYNHFDFISYCKEFPNQIILTTQQISKEYYDKMDKFIKSKKQWNKNT